MHLEQALDEVAARAHAALTLSHGRVPLIEPKLGVIAKRPLEVVHQRPVHDAAHIMPVCHRLLKLGRRKAGKGPQIQRCTPVRAWHVPLRCEACHVAGTYTVMHVGLAPDSTLTLRAPLTALRCGTKESGRMICEIYTSSLRGIDASLYPTTGHGVQCWAHGPPSFPPIPSPPNGCCASTNWQ